MSRKSPFTQSFLNIDKKASDKLSKYMEHEEAKEYGGCEYQLKNVKYVQRTAKVTPKKIGQFVTLWKCGSDGVTVPWLIPDFSRTKRLVPKSSSSFLIL